MNSQFKLKQQYKPDSRSNKYNLDLLSQIRKQQAHQKQTVPVEKQVKNFVEPKRRKYRRKKPLIPPTAQQQQQENTASDVIFSYLIYPLSVVKSMDKKTLIGIGLLALVSLGHAADVTNVCSNTVNGKNCNKLKSAEEKAIIKNQAYINVCTDKSKETYNKPNISLGIQNKTLKPKSCIKNSFFECIQDNLVYENFIPSTKVTKSRKKVTEQYSSWLKKIERECANIYLKLPREQESIFKEILAMLGELKKSHLRTIQTRIDNGGHCGEHTEMAIILLLRKKLIYDLDMKIQDVVLENSKSKNIIPDHEFLLLDSDINDIYISNDINKVKKTIEEITTGHICDPWNLGNFAKLKEEDSGLYSGDAGWDTLSIKTYTLNFANFNKLNIEAQRFFCNQLSQIGLSIEPREYCRMFNKENTKHENIINENQATQNKPSKL